MKWATCPIDSKHAYLFFLLTAIAMAILDRMLHHCKVINIKGHSYRLKEQATVEEQLYPKEGVLWEVSCAPAAA